MAKVSVKDSALLYALGQSSIDRIHLMKALFLPWYRLGKKIPNYFSFEPYLYGPCSFEVYSSLDQLLDEGLVAKIPSFNERWSKLRVTAAGQDRLREVQNAIEPGLATALRRSVSEIANLSLNDLLDRVYAEAPEFAIKSVYRPVLQRLKARPVLADAAR